MGGGAGVVGGGAGTYALGVGGRDGEGVYVNASVVCCGTEGGGL